MTTRHDLQHDQATLDTIYRRRAVRSYTPEQLEESTIRTLLEAAVHAPTAMHLEPWEFVVIQDRALLKRLSDRAKSMIQEEAAKHGDLVRPAAGSAARDPVALLADPSFNIFYDAGTLIVICAKPMGHFVTADCWLAAENLMLAACSLGLGSCCIGFAVPVLNTPEAKRELGIAVDETAVAPIIVGVPRGVPPTVPRKAPNILRWVR